MLLRTIEARLVKTNWYAFTAQLNAQQPVEIRTRLVRVQNNNTKVPKIFEVKKKAITISVTDTGAYLLHLYIQNYWQIRSNPNLRQAYTDGTLPSLFVNCVTLARKRNCSDRTIRNHVNKLLEIGLLSRKKFHGTKHDFELWIAPQFLFPEPLPPAYKFSKKGQITTPEAALRNNFPLSTTLELSTKVETTTTKVEKSGAALSQHALPGGEGTGDTSSALFSSDREPHQARIGQVKALNASSPKQLPAQLRKLGGAALMPAKGFNTPKSLSTLIQQAGYHPTGLDPAAIATKNLPPWQIDFVTHFWQYAKRRLYLDRNFTEVEEKAAKNAIYMGVYNRFRATKDPQQWMEYQQNVLLSLDLAHAYYRKHRKQYPADPFARQTRHRGYFDRLNPYGFIQVLHWQGENLKKQRSYRLIRIACNQIQKHIQGLPPKKWEHRTYRELYRFWEMKIYAGFGQEALDRYHAQVSMQIAIAQ